MTPTTPARPDSPSTTVDTVVLDLDGTLVDSVYVHVLAWRAAFAAVGLDVASHRLHRAIGLGGDRLVAHVAGDTEAPDPEQPLFGDVVTYELLCRRHFREGRVG